MMVAVGERAWFIALDINLLGIWMVEFNTLATYKGFFESNNSHEEHDVKKNENYVKKNEATNNIVVGFFLLPQVNKTSFWIPKEKLIALLLQIQHFLNH